MSRSVIENKIEQITVGNKKPRVLDLFAGCGGISLGFHSAGFKITGAVEFDKDAANTHAINFHARDEKHALAQDITLVQPEELLRSLGLQEKAEHCIDVIVGGPPCQAFARVGRAKLREVAEHPEAYLNDARGNLYTRYLAYVKKLKPVAILLENVPDVLNYGGHNIAEEICEVLSLLGYTCGYTLLNSVYYGVPQMRERMFLMAFAEELEQEVEFPMPTHWTKLPVGYQSSRSVALKTVQRGLFGSDKHFFEIPKAGIDLRPAITVEEALQDLPEITAHLEGKLRRGARRFDSLVPYRTEAALSEYAITMREWPGFENFIGIKDHVIRYLPRDYPIFSRMNHGDQYPEAYQHALDLFREKLEVINAQRETGITQDSEEYNMLKKSIIPPYDASKFPNKWRKLEPDQPSRTLMAHLGKDGYSHIHYDSRQARVISVREAARLQSFPDGFTFSGTMNPAFRQIGNSVPPLLSKAIAEVILDKIRSNYHAEETRRQTVNSF